MITVWHHRSSYLAFPAALLQYFSVFYLMRDQRLINMTLIPVERSCLILLPGREVVLSRQHISHGMMGGGLFDAVGIVMHIFFPVNGRWLWSWRDTTGKWGKVGAQSLRPLTRGAMARIWTLNCLTETSSGLSHWVNMNWINGLKDLQFI